MTLSKRSFLILLMLVLTSLAVASTFTPKAAACYAFGIHRYYSSSTYTTQVGQMTVYCNCTITRSGTQTSFVKYSPFDCSGGGVVP